MKRINLSFVIILAISIISATGCTSNIRAKKFGGTSTENLASGRKLVTATWKDASLWILTRPMRDGETPETYDFSESSSWGLVQGHVIIKESK